MPKFDRVKTVTRKAPLAMNTAVMSMDVGNQIV